MEDFTQGLEAISIVHIDSGRANFSEFKKKISHLFSKNSSLGVNVMFSGVNI